MIWQLACGDRFKRSDDGAWAFVARRTCVCEIEADARALLSAERPALNFLQLLSATATVTRRHVEAIAGASPNPRGCAVLDTRKTLPGLRQAQKYAVRVGGGQNQRLALWHGILIKENHIAAAGGIGPVLRQARELNSGVDIQIEVESLSPLNRIVTIIPASTTPSSAGLSPTSARRSMSSSWRIRASVLPCSSRAAW